MQVWRDFENKCQRCYCTTQTPKPLDCLSSSSPVWLANNSLNHGKELCPTTIVPHRFPEAVLKISLTKSSPCLSRTVVIVLVGIPTALNCSLVFSIRGRGSLLATRAQSSCFCCNSESRCSSVFGFSAPLNSRNSMGTGPTA